MDKKQSIYVFGSSLISLAISIFFSIIGWKYQELNIGLYFAVSLLGFSLLTIMVAVFITRTINQAEFNITNKIKESEVTSHSHKVNLLDELFKESEFIEIYSNGKQLHDHFQKKEVFHKKIKYYFYLDDKTDFSGVDIRTPFPSSLSALFFFSKNYESPQKCLLITSDNDFFNLPWLYISSEFLSSSMYKSYKNYLKTYAVDLSNAVDANWLHNKAKAISENFNNQWKLLKKHKMYYSTPLDIYKEQLSLSDGAKYIYAFDMTDIDEWFDQGNLGGCLNANICSANSFDDDGYIRVKRVFLAPSREYLKKNTDYREKLWIVINEHKSNNIGVGLIFQDEIRNKEYIQDFVVYDKKVVWVETVPTTRQSGAGYFSTNQNEVDKYINIFNEVWDYKYPMLPKDEASVFLEKTEVNHKKEIN